MDLSRYDAKYVQLQDIYGSVFIGVANYDSSDYCFHEFGVEEDGIQIEDFLIYRSQIRSIEEIEMHGTVELRTDQLILRPFIPEDAPALYKYLGADPDIARYSGWNPYATEEMARETVLQFIENSDDPHFYSWVIDFLESPAGTIGAYDYKDDRIEVGFSVAKTFRHRGFASEALVKVLQYLTEHEKIPCVTAWCASENIASKKTLEKAGMQLVRTEKNGLEVDGRVYDQLIYEYR